MPRSNPGPAEKRTEKGPYFIIHQLNHPACLDEAQTQGKRAAINPNRFQLMTKMVIDEQKVAAQRNLFRVAQYPKVPLIRRELADSLRAMKFTGLEFHEIEGFNFLLA